MTAQQELRTLNHDSIIELFEIDLQPIGADLQFRFCNFDDANTASVALDGVTYSAWPIAAEGFKVSSKGSLPEPTITVSNYQSTITALLINYNPAGATVTRRRILAKHLDGGSAPNPNAQFPADEFILDSWSENELVCQFRLVTALEYLNLQLPKRRIISLRQGA